MSMDNYLLDENHKLHVCSNNPDCDGFEVEEGAFKIKGYDGPTLSCHKCGSEMQLKTGRFGKYFGCMNDNCGATRAFKEMESQSHSYGAYYHRNSLHKV